MVETVGARPALLSMVPAERSDWRLAATMILVSIAVFLFVIPEVKRPLSYVWAFIPSYQMALAITDLLTAGLLLAQFTISRSRAILVLGCGYLFTACTVVPHTLSFPGLFSEAGLLPGAGSQTTAWLYMFWHGGFPLVVMAYAWIRYREGDAPQPVASHSSASEILAGIAAAVTAALAVTVVATVFEPWLPPMVEKGGYTPEMPYISTSFWALSFAALAALAALAYKRGAMVLDVWLMVVMCAWIADIALSAVFNGQRFDLGFYTGRIYGLVAACFVLVMMQVETAKMYSRLAQLLSAEQAASRRQAMQHRRIFDTSLDLILVVDRRGKLLQVSPSAMAILGYEPEEMIGRSAGAFVYPPDLENTRRQMRMARRGGVIRNFECRYVARSGRPVPLAWMGVWSTAERSTSSSAATRRKRRRPRPRFSRR